jgi:tRNA(Ile2) C34 agmatinyltransferase TiaS
MACGTCDHTMQKVAESVFWCPRCGTLSPNWEAPEPPRLVGFLREFHRMISDSPEGRALRSLAIQSGITEAIFKPEDRR